MRKVLLCTKHGQAMDRLPVFCGKTRNCDEPVIFCLEFYGMIKKEVLSVYRVLLVDDDADIQKANEIFLKRLGYQVLSAENGETALSLVRTAALDAVVLDVDMPGMDGLAVCRRIRQFSAVPILFLSAYGKADDRIRGLMAGSDDYLAKPYSLVELELRIRLRIQTRVGKEPHEVLRFGALEIDLALREVRYGDRKAELTTLEFDMLTVLARNPGQVFSYEQLYDRVWKAPINRGLHNIQVCAARLRHKLDALCPGTHYIETVRRKGYRFCAVPHPIETPRWEAGVE